MHNIRIDRARALVEIQLTGFLSPNDAQAAIEAGRAAIRTLGPRIGQHVTLFDIDGMNIASIETLARFYAVTADPTHSALWSRRLAICSGSALARLQVARLRPARDGLAIFDTREAALAWLLEPSAVLDTQAA